MPPPSEHNTTITTRPDPKAEMDLQQANEKAAAAQIAYFRAIPWCAALLSSSPPLIIDQATSRRLRPTEEDALLSQTLNTPAAIPAYIIFYRPPADPASLVREVGALVALGPMVNGWEGVCHGGVVVTLLDEAMGQVFAVNAARGVMKDIPVMTGQLSTRFVRPVRTGRAGEGARVVLVTARLVREEGRKYWVEGEVRGEEGGREVLARAEGVFIMLRERL
ncbi:hypothetical protein VTK56DRAFT_6620 [Thermocarpiscus australiensis]